MAQPEHSPWQHSTHLHRGALLWTSHTVPSGAHLWTEDTRLCHAPLMCAPHVCTCVPCATQLCIVPCATAQPELQVLVVPGNPGNAGYYRTLMTTLHNALGGAAHVLSCSHAGHNVHPTNSGTKVHSHHGTNHA